MSWTDERIGLLKKMWKEGKSAAEIAKTLGKGVTRNAVIGKAHRMGLSGRPSPIKKPAPAAKEKGAAPAQPRKEAAPKDVKKPSLPNAGKAGSPALAKEAEELKKIEKEIVPLGGGVSLLELTERMCKWPIGDPREADFTFCGRGIRVGTPYCPDHASMAYQSSSRSRGPAVANDKVVAAAAVVADDEEPETPDAADDEEEEEVA
jgi:GcrA cell cycle regulator